KQWLRSTNNYRLICERHSSTSQSSQLSQHPTPESVYVTKAPPSNIKSIPKLDTIPKDFNVLIIYFPHFNKILYKIFMPIYLPNDIILRLKKINQLNHIII